MTFVIEILFKHMCLLPEFSIQNIGPTNLYFVQTHSIYLFSLQNLYREIVSHQRILVFIADSVSWNSLPSESGGRSVGEGGSVQVDGRQRIARSKHPQIRISRRSHQSRSFSVVRSLSHVSLHSLVSPLISSLLRYLSLHLSLYFSL